MIEKFLREKIGLSYESIGRKNAETAVSRHMKRHGAATEKEYEELLSKSEKHFEELLQSVLVPETWFFRYAESFAFLSEHAEKHLAGRNDPLNVLCIPCSTGEEPYSIAMTLLNSGIPARLIHIDAFDISAPALEIARRAAYASNSFRGGIPEAMRRFFQIRDGRHEVVQQVKDQVRFRRSSIFDHGFTDGRPQYDLIFCRNMLIYFLPEEQNRAVETLAGMLIDGGILFLGHVESGMAGRRDFKSVKHPCSFAFRKKGEGHGAAIAGTDPANPALKHESHSRSQPGRALHKTQQPSSPPQSPPEKTGHATDALLEKAARSADRGELENAKALCLQYLDQDKLNPSAYYILGLVGLSSGKISEAETAFTKALYLDPEHYESLVHLALIKERQGEQAESQRIRRRAEKLTEAGR